MVIENKHNPGSSASRRRLSIGANVSVTIILFIAIVAVLQVIAYSLPDLRIDLTSSQINSLSDATVNLLRELDQPVRLTSLYFETDLEDDEQSQYRRTVTDLLDLYQSTQRSKITFEWINPLGDHEKLKEMVARLRDKERYKNDLVAYQSSIDLYKNELDERIKKRVHSELEAISSIGDPMGDTSNQTSLGQVQALFTRWTTELNAIRNQVDALTLQGNQQETAAVNVLKTLYREFGKILTEIPRYAMSEVSRNPSMSPSVSEFLRNSGNRYATLATDIESELTKVQNLEPLKIDELLRDLQPNSNAIIVEADDDVMVLDFTKVWPPMDRSRGGRARFKDRGFKGEEQLTSAILRATHQEQTAVVFVRWGGTPMFMGGFMPGQPQAPFTNVKRKLEDVNFIVDEWDLKTSASPPDIDPQPTRTIYIVFKPNPTPRGPMGQLGQEPPFGDPDRQKLLRVLGDNPRVMFIAGWAPGPFGPIPGTYEYNDYLKDAWGVHVDDTSLMIQTTNTAPGKYNITRRDFFNMQSPDLDVSDHDIVRGGQARLLTLPWCAPLELVESGIEGVEYDWLVSMGRVDGVWGVKNIQTYQTQMTQQEFLSLADGDIEGPFKLAVAVQKDDAKLVVVSSREFAMDNVAFAQTMAMTSRGITLRSRNPGNITLLVNSLHWLNDNTQYMNIGKPIDSGVLEIASNSTVTAIRVLTIFVWPAMALACGGFAWWIRRR